MVLHQQREPMRLEDIDQPQPQAGEVLIRVTACGVCRTDLHVVDADLDEPLLPLVPGHQIIGEVVKLGEGVTGFTRGDRVGVPWLGGSCGDCQFCLSAQENLCDHAQYTGYQRNGGFAEYTTANASYCFPVPNGFSDAQAAPLLCAGLIGHRAHRMAGSGKRLGLYGFGAAAHILIQVARHQGQDVYAFTREGDAPAQDYALSLGAVWAGDSQTAPPQLLDAAIIFAPDGALVPLALRAVRKGGRVVCAGIHMSEIPAFSYDLLWEERSICSVANLTRRDGDEFLPLAAEIPVITDVTEYPLAQANEALDDLRAGRVTGALVIRP
ncbi:MAG: zinc-dependent alcohol dehydrogenase family protein [Halieaceae bacterium]